MKWLIKITMRVANFVKDKILELFIKKEMLEKLINEETVTYILFGVLTTIVNLVVFVVMQRVLYIEKYSDIILLLNNSVAWVVAVLFAYYTNRIYVFKSQNYSSIEKWKEFISFIAARLFSLLVDCVGLWLIVEVLSGNDVLGKVIMNIIVVIINYFFSKLFIFNKKAD